MAGPVTEAIGDSGMGLLSGLGSSMMQVVIILVGFFILGGIIFGVTYWWLRVKKSYNYQVFVFEPDAMGGYDAQEDKGGVFTKKKLNQKFFWLKDRRVPMSPQFPYISLKTKNGLKKMVFLLRDGPSQYRFIHPEVSPAAVEEEEEVGFAGDAMFKALVPKMVAGELKLNVKEEDVNWAAYAYKEVKAEQGLDWMKWVDVGVHVLVVGLLMFMFIYLIKEGLPVMKDVAGSMSSAAEAMKEATLAGKVI